MTRPYLQAGRMRRPGDLTPKRQTGVQKLVH